MSDKTFMAQLKVLYVEDDKETRDTLATFLKRRVGKLFTAADGYKALAVFRAENPDIVIADLLMPDMHGIDMLKTMRADSEKCVFIITSSVNEAECMLQAIDLGVVKYAVKPLNLPDFDKLLTHIAESMHKRLNEELPFGDDRKKEYETAIKKETALFLKQNAGKGPRDVTVFIHDKSIDIVAYDTLTPLENKLMSNKGNYSIVEQARRNFYIESRHELETAISMITGRSVSLQTISIHPDRSMDKIIFEI